MRWWKRRRQHRRLLEAIAASTLTIEMRSWPALFQPIVKVTAEELFMAMKYGGSDVVMDEDRVGTQQLRVRFTIPDEKGKRS